MTKQNTSLTCGGYHADHPWYYLLGGVIPKPSEIKAAAEQSNYCGYKTGDLIAIDKQAEPKRTKKLRQ